MRELMEAYEEFIKHIDKWNNDNIMFLYFHGIEVPEEISDKGSKLKGKINSLKKKLFNEEFIL